MVLTFWNEFHHSMFSLSPSRESHSQHNARSKQHNACFASYCEIQNHSRQDVGEAAIRRKQLRPYQQCSFSRTSYLLRRAYCCTCKVNLPVLCQPYSHFPKPEDYSTQQCVQEIASIRTDPMHLTLNTHSRSHCWSSILQAAARTPASQIFRQWTLVYHRKRKSCPRQRSWETAPTLQTDSNGFTNW